MNGYIRLFRKFTQWEWYKNINTKIVFLHCLLKANWEDSKFEGQVIKRGSFVTGRKKLAKELCITEQQVRTALQHLISTNEITINKTNKYSIISIVNYDMYQIINQEDNQQITNNQPTNNQQVTTYEEDKEDKKINNKKENIKRKNFIKPTLEEVKTYCKERKNSVDVERFIDYYEANGWKVGRNPMKDWKASIRTWERNDGNFSNKSKEEKLPNWFNKENSKEVDYETRRLAEELTNGTWKP